jgi:hypothetical protein
MQVLLAAGPDAGGIDADEFEAALQIVETYKALTAKLGIHPARLDDTYGGNGGMSDRDAEAIACWFHWSAWLPVGLPTRLVREIEDDEPIRSVTVLRRACRSWHKVRADRSRSAVAVDNPPPVVTLPIPVALSYGGNVRRPDIAATPPNFPVERFQPRPGVLSYAACSAPTRHAQPPRHPPTTRR